MKACLSYFCFLTVLTLSHFPVHAAPTDANPPTGFRLTVELRDGSKIIGKSADDHFQFNSDVLGAMNLPLGKIRAIECQSQTNLVRLTTTSGDSLTAGFAMNEIRVATTFGEVTLPVASIKSVRVAAWRKTGRPTDGLIGLWSGNGNAVDSVGENNGVLQNVSFTDGVAGQAFTFSPNSFNGVYVGLQIPDRPAYALQSLTIEAWVRPRGDGYMILTRGDHRPGLDPYTLSMQGNHDLCFNICDNSGTSAKVDATIPYGEWTHVAATFDADSGTMCLYTNGLLAAQTETSVRPIQNLIPEMSPGIGIGNINDGGNNFPFVGDIDEVGLYDRALSADEVGAIYNENAANAGGRAEMLPSRPMRNFGMPVRILNQGFISD